MHRRHEVTVCVEDVGRREDASVESVADLVGDVDDVDVVPCRTRP